MIKLEIYRPTENNSVIKYECDCGTVNVRGIFTFCLEYMPFVCYKCFSILPSVVNLVTHKSVRIDYHISKVVPKASTRNV